MILACDMTPARRYIESRNVALDRKLDDLIMSHER